jgi:hypothetical protein
MVIGLTEERKACLINKLSARIANLSELKREWRWIGKVIVTTIKDEKASILPVAGYQLFGGIFKTILGLEARNGEACMKAEVKPSTGPA